MSVTFVPAAGEALSAGEIGWLADVGRLEGPGHQLAAKHFSEVPPHLVHLLTAAVPVLQSTLATVVGAWLHERYGRKVRIKVGDTETEAASMAEAEKGFELARQARQASEPKRIYEP